HAGRPGPLPVLGFVLDRELAARDAGPLKPQAPKAPLAARPSAGGGQAEIPPSLLRSWPLIQPPWGEHRKSTRCAVSRGVPRRPSGVCSAQCPRTWSGIHPVSTGPGLITLAVTPRCASSRAEA